LSHTTRSIYQGRILQLGIETLTLPNGETVELEIVRHPGGAAVVALDDREQVCLLRQYRHASGGWLWELPAGKLEADEKPQTTAKRELLEETGIQAAQWQTLGNILVTPGFCDEVIHLFLARELTQLAAQPQTHEVIEVHWIPFEQALARVFNGALRDAKTMLGLTLAEKQIRRQ
jgi:8-oxo-dGTP pyrophosphatase MutT (NUDIX family)